MSRETGVYLLQNDDESDSQMPWMTDIKCEVKLNIDIDIIKSEFKLYNYRLDNFSEGTQIKNT